MTADIAALLEPSAPPAAPFRPRALVLLRSRRTVSPRNQPPAAAPFLASLLSDDDDWDVDDSGRGCPPPSWPPPPPRRPPSWPPPPPRRPPPWAGAYPRADDLEAPLHACGFDGLRSPEVGGVYFPGCLDWRMPERWLPIGDLPLVDGPHWKIAPRFVVPFAAAPLELRMVSPDGTLALEEERLVGPHLPLHEALAAAELVVLEIGRSDADICLNSLKMAFAAVGRDAPCAVAAVTEDGFRMIAGDDLDAAAARLRPASRFYWAYRTNFPNLTWPVLAAAVAAAPSGDPVADAAISGEGGYREHGVADPLALQLLFLARRGGPAAATRPAGRLPADAAEKLMAACPDVVPLLGPDRLLRRNLVESVGGLHAIRLVDLVPSGLRLTTRGAAFLAAFPAECERPDLPARWLSARSETASPAALDADLTSFLGLVKRGAAPFHAAF